MFQETKELPVIDTAPRVGRWHQDAEDIRNGCRMTPTQAFKQIYVYQGYQNYQKIIASCVVGALREAREVRRATELSIEYDRATIFQCPAYACQSRLCGSELLVHLNDYHKMSREAIANWLDQQ